MESGRTSIRHACQTFVLSETGYRYQAKASAENARIADWLVRLTTAYRDWGFGLCFLHLRNVKGFGWNHKRVYRIYRELELNLRIKPRKRIVRERPEPLAVPGTINQVWSMDFMHDQLSDGRSFQNRGQSALSDVRFWSVFRGRPILAGPARRESCASTAVRK
ncbi:hypothetical protein ACVWWQ_000788 [Rhodanobacter sp. TND4EL1]